jgi:hypothetical protein
VSTLADTVTAVLDHLEQLYGQNLLPPMRAVYVEALAKVDPILLPDGVIRATKRSGPTRMPSVDQVLSGVGEIRAERLYAQKLGTPTRVATIRERTPHGRESIALLQQIAAGVLTVADQVEAFREMAVKHPGLGWEKAVADAERRLARL